MGSILPKINSLIEIPLVHQAYAEALLKLVVEKLLGMESFEIGTFREDDKRGSIVAFDGDYFENVQLELRFCRDEFCLIINTHGDDFNMSNFRYRIPEDTNTYLMIPEKLREAMENVVEENEPVTFAPRSIS